MQPLYGSQGPEYALKDITDETTTKYKVCWDGIDPQTGRPWSKTWIPKHFANREAVDAWEDIKRQRRRNRKRPRLSLTSSPPSPPRIRIHPRKRLQILSSSFENINNNKHSIRRTSTSLSQLSTDYPQRNAGNRKYFVQVKVSLLTSSQKERYNTYKEPLCNSRSSSTRLVTEVEIPDSQPNSPSIQSSVTSQDFTSKLGPGTLSHASHSSYVDEPVDSKTSSRKWSQSASSLHCHLPSIPILQPIEQARTSCGSSSPPLRTPSPSASTSQAFETQIVISRNNLIETIERDFVAEDFEQDGQGNGTSFQSASLGGIETLSYTEASERLTNSSSSSKTATVLSQVDTNSQPYPVKSQTDKNSQQRSKASNDRFLLVQSFWGISPRTAQENIVQSLYPFPIASQEMAHIRPTIDSLLSGPPPGTNSSGSGDLRDQLRNVRALSAANTTALRASIEAGQTRQDSRSPSVIPEPIQYKPVGDSRLEPKSIIPPVPRYPNQLSPHAPNKPSKLSSPPQTAQVDIITQLEPPKLGSASYAVPLPLPGRVRDQYYSTIRYYQRATNNLASMPYPDHVSIKDVEKMVARLNDVSNHVDLDDETTANNALSLDDEFQWAVTCSAKFRFLKHLLEYMRQDDFHIVIFAEQGRILDILDRFIESSKSANLKRLGLGARNVDIISTDGAVPPLRVTLIGSDSLEEPHNLQCADLIIAFDSTFNSSAPIVNALRRQPNALRRLCPIIYPMVYSSVEHIERCVPTMKSEVDQLRVVTQCVLQTRQEVGELQPEEAKPDAAAEEIAAFVRLGGSERDWTLFPIRSIQLVGLELELANQGYPSMSNIEQPMDAASRKRHIDTVDNYDIQTKRQRMTPIPDATHISNSVPSQSSETGGLRAELLRVKAALTTEQEAHAKSRERLQNLVDRKEEEVREQMSALGGLQTRFEQLSRECNSFRSKNEDLQRGVSQAEERYAKLLIDYKAARDDCKSKQADLEEAQKRLENLKIPEAAELQRLRSENERLSQDKMAADRRANSAQEDREYAQGLYQDASSKAVQATQRLEELESQLTRYQSLATGEALKLRSKNNDEEVKQYATAFEKSAAELEDLKEQVRRKERGRGMNTRAGSTAPRSPRPGNSPTRSRANSRAPGSTSRPVSPIRSLLGTRKARGMVD